MAKLIDWLVRKWMAHCRHDGGHVAFDILEGGCPGTYVNYCRRCGAVRIAHGNDMHVTSEGAWRSPEPTWHPEPRS